MVSLIITLVTKSHDPSSMSVLRAFWVFKGYPGKGSWCQGFVNIPWSGPAGSVKTSVFVGLGFSLRFSA